MRYGAGAMGAGGVLRGAWLRRLALGGAALLATAGMGQAADGPFIAEPGKDAPYVVTPYSVVTAMLEIASVGAEDFVIDLGSGDGRIAIMAAQRYGARAVGVELNADLIETSRQAAAEAGLGDRATFRQENIFETDLTGATVVTMYLMPEANMQLRPLMLDLPPGTRVVSHAFHMEDWRPDESIVVHEADGGGAVHLWVVPGDAQGRWAGRIGDPLSGQPFRLELMQTFQDLEGRITLDGRAIPIRDTILDGDRIEFVVEDAAGQPVRRFTGQLRGDSLEGNLQADGAEHRWQATRIGGKRGR